MTTTSTGLRLVLFALAASTSLSGLAAQTAPAGRPIRTLPAPSATPTPSPTPAQTAPAPIRLRAPQPAATPAPAPAPAPAPVAKPAATPVAAPAKAPAVAPAVKTAPAATAKPSAGPVATAPLSLPKIDPNSFTVPKVPLNMIIPPSSPKLKPIPGTTLLTGRSYKDTIGKLPIARQFTAKQLRDAPRVTVGTSEIDFTPMLKDPRSLPNVAQRMRGMSTLITVEADEIEAAELKDLGLAVRSIVTYRLKPGACDNPQNRAKLATVMVRCFEQQTDAEIEASFSDPASPRYFKERTRDAVIASSRKQRQEMQAKINQRIGEMRIRMKEPQLRKDLVAGASEAEVTRLSAMSDAALTRELINQGRFKIEDSLFIPRLDASDLQQGTAKDGVAGSNPQAGAQAPNGDVSVTAQVPPMQFLTGFTLGREYEWQLRIEATIPWCLVGCEETYYAEAFAGFGAGLGLRLPFEVSGTYKFERAKGVETATFTPSMKTVNADNAFYSAVQLPPEKHFQGQELLAKFGAWAGLRADLPIVGDFTIGKTKDNPFGVDFTADLPGDFKNGQFTPPLPCPPAAGPGHPCKKAPTFVKDFDDLDLTGGIANIGIAGVKVFPFVKGELFSNGLTVQLVDKLGAGTPAQVISATEPGKAIKLGINKETKASTFVIAEPSYNLGMKLTPGITARLFIDLAVWGTHWDFDVELPQLGIQVPKGGKNFSCHDQTLCDRTVTISPQGVSVAASTASPYNTLASWYEGFEKKWIGTNQCYSGERAACEANLRAHRDKTVNDLGAVMSKTPGYSPDTLDVALKSANLTARDLIIRSHMKFLASHIRGFKDQCFDDGCRADIEKQAFVIEGFKGVGADYSASLSAIEVRNLLDEQFRSVAIARVAKSKKQAGK